MAAPLTSSVRAAFRNLFLARELASKCHLPFHQQQSSFDPRPVFAI